MNGVKRTPPSREAARAGYETADVPPRSALAAAGGLVALVLLAAAAAALMLDSFDYGPAPPGEASFARPGPGLSTDPTRELTVHRQSEDIRLEAFGWVDRQAGIARIPIGEAMRLVAREGWPEPPAPEAGR